MNNKHILSRIVLAFSLLSLLILLLLPSVTSNAAPRLQKTGNPIIIVIDPGHGGEENTGTTECGFVEKDMNLLTAKIMAEELSKYDGVKVYLTRDGDYDLTLKKRAQIASEYHADFLISLHYNASESHLLYGSETWVSLNPDYHNQGYQLGTAFLREFREMGLTLRGIKTRRHSKGSDYYGILRESVALGVPAIIVEHCHVDHARDNVFCDSEEELIAFGEADARAVAKYFGLKSASLGIDYSEEANRLPEVTVGALVPRAAQDLTNPEYCHVALLDAKYEEDLVTVQVSAKDSDSNLLYYAYSLDGGVTYTETIPWPEGDILTGEFSGTFTLELTIPDGTTPQICFRAVNPYDLDTASNVLVFDKDFQKLVQEESHEQEYEDATGKLAPEAESSDEDADFYDTIYLILKLGIAIVGTLFIVFLIAFLAKASKTKKESQGEGNTKQK